MVDKNMLVCEAKLCQSPGDRVNRDIRFIRFIPSETFLSCPRIPVLLTAEFIEDHIVTNELLPINPAGPGLLKINAAGTEFAHIHEVGQGILGDTTRR